MRCVELAEDLSGHLDGELEPGRSATVEQHLASCAGCRANAEAMRQTVGLLRVLPEAAPPTDLRVRTLDRLAAAVVAPEIPCEQAQPLLHAHLDGAVAGPQARLLQSHLAECSSCRRELATLRATVELMRGMPPVVSPHTVRAHVQAARRPAPVIRLRWRPRVGRVFATAGALAVGVAMTVIVWRHPQPNQQVAVAPSSTAKAASVAPDASVPATSAESTLAPIRVSVASRTLRRSRPEAADAVSAAKPAPVVAASLSDSMLTEVIARMRASMRREAEQDRVRTAEASLAMPPSDWASVAPASATNAAPTGTSGRPAVEETPSTSGLGFLDEFRRSRNRSAESVRISPERRGPGLVGTAAFSWGSL